MTDRQTKTEQFNVRGIRLHSLRTTIPAAMLIMALGSTAVMAQAPVSDPSKLEARLRQLERSMSGSSLVQMHETLQNLAREVRELRGEVEQQAHSVEQLKRRQRDMFLDLDRRIQTMETTAATPTSDASATETPAVSPASAPKPLLPAPGIPAPGVPAPGVPAPIVAAPGVPTPSVTSTEPQAIPPQPPPGTVAAVDPAEEQKAYRAAFELLKGGKFKEASVALTNFLSSFPNGNFADNAQYWLGEAYYVSREFGPALKAFEQVLVDYPDSPKRPHSMLKIGFIHDESGQTDLARKMLTELTQKYPQSTAASLAAKRLKRLR